MTNDNPSIEECIDKADKIFVDEKDKTIYTVDTSTESIYKFSPSDEKITQIIEENGSISITNKKVISIEYSQQTEYQSNSRFREVNPPTKDQLGTVLFTVSV